ncbi:MAG: PAS domain S-box protein [Acidiphilium sp.]|nr:PAS domain S-box protein [Acidiphilium sp.]
MTDISEQGQWAFLAGGGEVAELIVKIDWAGTSIGGIEGWSNAMRSMLAFVLRSSTPMITLWGEKGVMIYNDAFRGFAGDRHPAILGRDVLEGWYEVSDFNANVMQKVYHEGGALSYQDFELTLVRGGAPSRLWANLRYSPAVDESGTVIGVVAIVVETTATVLASRSLQDERRRLLQMAEHSPSFMALLEGPGHEFTMVNPAYLRLLGNRDVVGRTVAEAVPEAARQGFIELLDCVYMSGKPFWADGALIRIQAERGGSFDRYVDFVYQPMTDPAGAVTGIFVSGVDVTDRMRAQLAIAASEKQFRTFAQVLPNHIWTALPTGELDWFNDQIFAYSGLGEEDLHGDRWTGIVHPDDVGAAAEKWAAALASGQTYETEFRIRRADGAYLWHLVRALPVRDDEGLILRWVGTNTNIHDQKLSLAESVADRNRLWRISRDLMLVCTTEGTITAVNPSSKRMLGWDEDEMIGRRLADFIHPEDISDTLTQFAEPSSDEATFSFENRYRTKDGDFRLLAWRGVLEAGHIHAVGRNITNERALARDRERFWNLSPTIKVVMDTTGHITDVNPSWTQTLGWSRDETIGKRSADFMIEDEQVWAECIRKLSSGAPVRECRTTLMTKDGAQRLVQWSTVPENGSFYGFGRDMTAEVQAASALAETEAALRQSQKMEAVGQLTGGIAHDFNNLLQGITGNLEIIQRRVQQGRLDDLTQFVAGASGAAQRAAALTHRLLAFSRRQPLDPKPVDANSLLASMEDLVRRTIGEPISFALVLAPDLWVTRCDANQLESAVLNLVINARDAMPDGGTLTIETSNAHLDKAYAASQLGIHPGEYVVICVTDTGIGMDQDTIAKAFEPFFTTKPIGQGTGLGLSMIYGFSQQSEGYTKIYSEIGKGTTIKLYLPRFRGNVVEHDMLPQLTDDHNSQAGELVLVVEDDAIVRGLVVEQLRELGYEAIEAFDGPGGLEILRSVRHIDLLITDVGLPGLNGRQMADGARALRPELKVLFMTGYAENAAVSSGFLEPGMELITKPFAMETFASRIRSILSASRPVLPFENG